MIRQRVNLRTPLLAYLTRALMIVLALGLLWYGLMVVLLAVKVSPHTVNSLSAYRTLYDDAVGLKPADFTTLVRLIAGFGGLIAFLLFIYLAFQELPARISLAVRYRWASLSGAGRSSGRGRSSASPRSPPKATQMSSPPPAGWVIRS